MKYLFCYINKKPRENFENVVSVKKTAPPLPDKPVTRFDVFIVVKMQVQVF